MVERFAVYILASTRNGTLYIGVTNDLLRRIFEHRSGAVPGFTRDYGVTRLVHVEFFASVTAAREREGRLKRWHRPWKIEWIEAANPTWRDLTEEFSEIGALRAIPPLDPGSAVRCAHLVRERCRPHAAPRLA
ncbi:MAG TPA: GIY-YIG nuclease family protein [Xanthobacteraceae bacterium]|nr:GIY-YIG nuclease family protein [Xanthobacteraceae bacterium]